MQFVLCVDVTVVVKVATTAPACGARVTALLRFPPLSNEAIARSKFLARLGDSEFHNTKPVQPGFQRLGCYPHGSNPKLVPPMLSYAHFKAGCATALVRLMHLEFGT